MNDLNDYQENAHQFRLPVYSPEAAVMGLLSEAGEVAGVFQKMLRGDYNLNEASSKLYKELGDVLWHIAAIAKDNNWKLEDIAADNIKKLEDRKARNVIKGAGDER